jgi:chromosome segregation ATPase
MSTNDDVLKFARAELSKRQGKLIKRQQTLSSQIATLQTQVNLNIFAGSISSAPLKQFVKDHMDALGAQLSKHESALESVRKELDDINRLLDSMPRSN